MIYLQVIETAVICLWLYINASVAMFFTESQMKEELVTKQPFLKKIFGNAFYAPAWVMKGIRNLVVHNIA